MKFIVRSRYILTDEKFPKIVGRVYGGDGSASYQLAARPYDELPVHGHPTIDAAITAAITVLNQRQEIPSVKG